MLTQSKHLSIYMSTKMYGDVNFAVEDEWRGSSAWRERAIANRQVAGSIPAPATILQVKLAARC